MTLNSKLYTAISLNEFFVDKNTGEPLAGGTIEFFRDSSRVTNKLVYGLSGTEPNYTYTSLGSTLTLNDSGQVVDGSNNPIAVYYYPYLGTPADDPTDNTLDLYYVVCEDSGGGSQWTKEAVPNLTADSDVVQDIQPATNQLSNPQFSKTFIDETNTIAYTVTAATDEVLKFAPNWDFILSGTGTVTVTRTAVAGNSKYVTSPPYVLRIAVGSGITKCELRQRFAANSGLWSSTSADDEDKRYLVAGCLAQGITGNVDFQIFYEESTSGGAQSVLSDTATTGDYVWYQSNTAVEINQSTNTDTGDDGYVDVYLSITSPQNKTIDVTSFQVITVNTEVDTETVTYERRSSNREQAMMGDYYIPALSNKTAESMLTGWDFGLNPAQWGTTATLSNTVSATNYIWDQTIALDTAGNATVARDGNTGGFQVTTVAGTQNSFCLAQYLDGEQARALVQGRLSVNVNAFRNGGGAVTMRVYLYRATDAAAYPDLGAAEFIATRNTDGTLTSPFTGWTEIPRGGLTTATATLNAISTKADITSDDNNYGFNNWELTDATQIDDTDKFCIAVTFAYATTATVVTINDISLVRGDIPCKSAPKTQLQVLDECRYYYEQSYANGVAAGTATAVGELVYNIPTQQTGPTTSYSSGFTLNYSASKLSIVTPKVYSSDGTADNVSVTAGITVGLSPAQNRVFATYWSIYGNSKDRVSYIPNGLGAITSTTDGAGARAWIAFHYIADSRIGTVVVS